MRFGDIIVKQLTSIAKGMSLVPSLANFYVAIHEVKNLLKYCGNLFISLRRFMDDGLGIWIHNPDAIIDAYNWKSLQ